MKNSFRIDILVFHACQNRPLTCNTEDSYWSLVAPRKNCKFLRMIIRKVTAEDSSGFLQPFVPRFLFENHPGFLKFFILQSFCCSSFRDIVLLPEDLAWFLPRSFSARVHLGNNSAGLVFEISAGTTVGISHEVLPAISFQVSLGSSFQDYFCCGLSAIFLE